MITVKHINACKFFGIPVFFLLLVILFPCSIFGQAEQIYCGNTYSGTTGNTSTISLEFSLYTGNGGEAFYSFVPEVTGFHTIEVEITAGCPIIYAVSTSCDDNANNILADTVVIPNSPNVSLNPILTAGVTYYIILDSYMPVARSFSISVTCPESPTNELGCNDLSESSVGTLPVGWNYTVNVYPQPNDNFVNYSTTPASVYTIEAQYGDMMTQSIYSHSRTGYTCAAVGSRCLYIEYAPKNKTYCQDVYIYPLAMHLYPATYSYSALYSTEIDMSINSSSVLEGMMGASVCNLYFGTSPDYTQMTQMSGMSWKYMSGGGGYYIEPLSACNSFVKVSGTFDVSVEGIYYVCMKVHANSPASYDNGYPAFITLDEFCISGNNIIMPIELISFSATCNGKSSIVSWTTASERNNDHFILERSADAVNFSEVARLAGAGNSIAQLDYLYTDYGVHGGDNYYRLWQVDYDGTRSVSEIVLANCQDLEAGDPDVLAYPSPFGGELTIELENFDNRPAIIEIYDMLGKLVYLGKVESPQNSYYTVLNLGHLPPAAYNVRVSTADFVINRQVVRD